MSVSSKRFILGEDDGGIVSPVAVKSTQRRNGRRCSKYSLRTLQELDETVASVGEIYRSPRRPGEDDFSIDSNSNTIITNDGHAIYTHRHLIVNMPNISRGGASKDFRSVQSHRTNQSTTGRSQRSKSSRHKRGNSLERTISRTILQTAASGVESAHFLVAPEGRSSSSETPVDFILHDLVKVDTAIQSGARSVKISVEPNPLPEKTIGPLPWDAPENELFSTGDLFSQGKPREYVVTPVTSDETPPQAEEADAPPFDLDESFDDPFAQIDLQQMNSSPWSNSNGDEEAMESDAVKPKEEIVFRAKKTNRTKRAAVSKQAIQKPSSADPVESLFNVDGGWTTFDANAFEFDVSFPGKKYSRRSPSSIVEFGVQMRQERQLNLAFSQSTESAFSSRGLTSTMAVI